MIIYHSGMFYQPIMINLSLDKLFKRSISTTRHELNNDEFGGSNWFQIDGSPKFIIIDDFGGVHPFIGYNKVVIYATILFRKFKQGGEGIDKPSPCELIVGFKDEEL